MRPVLIAGCGTLGRAFERLCRERGLAARLTNRADLDIADDRGVAAMIDTVEPWLVVNAAGYVRVDDAEGEPERCYRENALGPETLARRCARNGVPLIVFSSDLVFDGAKHEPYEEHDEPQPLGVYGRSKLQAERSVMELLDNVLVVRTSAFFGPWDQHNFVSRTAATLASGQEVRAAEDAIVSPTYVPDLVHTCLDLAIDGETGLWHLANTGATSWADLAHTVARISGHPAHRVVPVPGHSAGWRAARPRNSALRSVRGDLLPPLEDALLRYHGAVGRQPSPVG